MSKQQYPAKEGWIRMEFTMKDSTPHGLDEIKNLASWGKPETYEFGPISQHGKKIKVIAREKKAEVRT